jgi:hypothetical protein
MGKFIKLSRQANGGEVFVRAEAVTHMWPTANGATVIFFGHSQEAGVRVKEDAASVMRMLAEAV